VSYPAGVSFEQVLDAIAPLKDRTFGWTAMLKSIDRRGRGRQFAALPIGRSDGETLVLLVTSRETRRWVLPKGWAEKGLTGAELAAKEAIEEAGAIGEVAAKPIGSYSYVKLLPFGRETECKVKVFPMRVDRLLDDWPERDQRQRQWFTLPQAAMAVEDGELVTLLLRLAAPEP
jgi:8-oxo-dGTP pyrophosphatase MutT (NUDIX family)